MFTPPTNDEPERFLAYHADGLRAIQAAIDDGISYADGLLHQQRHEASFWSHAVRYHTKSQLIDLAKTATTWKMGRELNNDGIEITRDLQVLRVLRQEGGQPRVRGGTRLVVFITNRPWT